jgi:biopolymer transport protein ExbB
MAVETQAAENPMSLMVIWEQGPLSQGIFIVLSIMSLLTWFITITKWWEQRRLKKQYADVMKEAQKGSFFSGNLRDNVEKLKGKDNAYRMIAEEGMRAAEQHEGHLSDQVALNEWITVSLQRAVDSVSNRLTGGLWFLATTGSISPFVGLLGTVMGIYKALIAISAAGQASLEKTAGPIGEALLMTALGLMAALPAVFFYNVLIRRNKDVMEKTRFFASGVHSFLISSTRMARK